MGVFGKRREWDRSQGSADMLPLGDGAEAGGGRWPELKTRVKGWRHFDLAMESGISLQVFSLDGSSVRGVEKGVLWTRSWMAPGRCPDSVSTAGRGQ